MDGSDGWVHPQMGSTARPPLAFMTALQHVVLTLGHDPAWAAWWRQSGTRSCELGIVAEGRLDHLRPSADIRQVGDQVRANFTSASPPTEIRRPADLFPLAVAEVTGMFEVIREAIGLPPLPDVPPLPDLPADAGAVEVTSRSLPSPPPEEDQEGYLTLAQIQEFFR